jgi:hypothetical protein
MNLAYLGDALDHWKGALFQFLTADGLLRDFAVDSMATDGPEWTTDDLALFARLLHVTESQIVRHKAPLAARNKYFAEITHGGDLFLDPDTGIDTGGGSPIEKYIKPNELADLLQKPGRRVVAVYQHVRAQKTCVRVDGCLRALAAVFGGTGWCSYESGTVAMLFLSRDTARTSAIAKGFCSLLGKHAKGRVRSGVTERAAHHAAEIGSPDSVRGRPRTPVGCFSTATSIRTHDDNTDSEAED